MNENFKRIAGQSNFGGADKVTNEVVYDPRLEKFATILIDDVVNTLMNLHKDADGSHNHYHFAANVIKEKYSV